jgi:hypothetical protein
METSNYTNETCKRRLSVMVGCYGNYPHYSVRAVESLLKHCVSRDNFELFVGCNESGADVIQQFRKHLDLSNIDILVESRKNINKDPMMRVLLECCQTPYLLWLDDDSHVLPGWDGEILRYITENHPFDIAGHVFYINHRSEEYKTFLRKRPWYVSSEREQIPIWFATGGLFLASVEFLGRHSFPDHAMIKHADDVLLGDLCQQQLAILKDFGGCRAIMDRIKISDGNRRGSGEGAGSWLKIHPITGSQGH